MILTPITAFPNTPVQANAGILGIQPNSTVIYPNPITGLSSNTLSPLSSYFEGMPIYLFGDSSFSPFLVPKIPELPVTVSSSPVVQNEQRVDTSKHFHVFVGDLSSEIDNKALRDAFAHIGEISDTKVIRDSQTLKPKGYGFVSFVNREDAERAISQMNGHWLGRRTIRTNWATRKSSRTSTGNSVNKEKERERDKDNGDQSNDDCGPPPARRRQIKNLTYEEIVSQTGLFNSTVYIGGAPSNLTDEELRDSFNKYGCIVETRIFRQQGYAFVKYDRKESAAQAILHANNSEINGNRIKCSWGKENGGAGTNLASQCMYNIGYNFSVPTNVTSNLNNFWSQWYQHCSNPQWQTLFQHPQLTGQIGGSIQLNTAASQ